MRFASLILKRIIFLSILLFVASILAMAQPYNGTLHGTPVFGPAKFSNGLTSVTDANYLSLPSGVFNFSSSSSWALEAWLKTTGSSTGVAIASGSLGDIAPGQPSFWFGTSGGNFVLNITGSGAFTGTLDSGIAINDGAFHHCAISVNGGTTIKLYVDGVLGNTFTGVVTTMVHTNGLIGRYTVTSFAWNSAIDEIAVWGSNKYPVAFTPPSSPYVGTESNLIALYHLQANGVDSSTPPGISASPNQIVISTTGNSVVLTGITTTWTPGTPGTPTFTLSGGTGASITAQTIASGTSATLTITAGSALGVLTITDPSTGFTTTVTVVSTPSTSTIPMSDPGIIFSPYNWNVTGGTANTVNPGAYFRTIFNGTQVSLNFTTSADSSPYPQLWARVDNQYWQQIVLTAGNPQVLITSSLQNRKHLVEVVVKSTSYSGVDRWSGPQTIVTVTGIVVDYLTTLSLPIRKTKNILIYGDSITEGLLSKNNTASGQPDQSDILGCYSYALSTAVDAEVGIVAFGGTGLLTSFAGVPALTSSYNLIYNGASRVFTPAPDLVIYNEGTNDGSSIVTAYGTVVSAILAAAPNAKQLLLIPFNNSHASDIATVVTNAGNPKVTSQSTVGWFNSSDSSDGLHPYDYSHVGLIAPKLFPVVMALLYPSTCLNRVRTIRIIAELTLPRGHGRVFQGNPRIPDCQCFIVGTVDPVTW